MNFFIIKDSNGNISIAKKVLISILIAVLLKFVTLIFDITLGSFIYYEPSHHRNDSLLVIVIDMCFFGVLFEELSFRYFIFQDDLRKMLISFSFFLSFLLMKVFDGIVLPFNLILLDLIELVGALLIFLLLWIYYSRLGSWKVKIQKGLSQIIASSLIFGLVHIRVFNSNIINQLIFIVPIILLGFVLSIIRVNFGFKYAILLHFVYNAIAAFALWFVIK